MVRKGCFAQSVPRGVPPPRWGDLGAASSVTRDRAVRSLVEGRQGQGSVPDVSGRSGHFQAQKEAETLCQGIQVVEERTSVSLMKLIERAAFQPDFDVAKLQAMLAKYNELKATFEAESLKLDKSFQELSATLTGLVDKAYADAKVDRKQFDLNLIDGQFVKVKPPETPAK